MATTSLSEEVKASLIQLKGLRDLYSPPKGSKLLRNPFGLSSLNPQNTEFTESFQLCVNLEPAWIFPSATGQSTSSSCAETHTFNLINGTSLMSSGMKRSKNEVLLLNQLWHYSPPPSGGHNFHTGAPIDAPFVATRNSLHPLRFYPIIQVWVSHFPFRFSPSILQKLRALGVFVFSRFLSFQEHSSSIKGHEPPPMWMNEGKLRKGGRKGDSKLEDALGAMGMEAVLGCSKAVEPRMHVLSLEFRYSLGLVKGINSNPPESTRLRSFLIQIFSKSFESTLKGSRVNSYMDRSEFGLITLQGVDSDEIESTRMNSNQLHLSK
ncbi:hypothetical protein PIB30_102935 [Stylosanthes scabra]|uniref:Uncharacterized protein n=1 Tax=Stylosanthes scabra TaxID=79078 RepID=A0ABU6YVJ6_9FABA|nr:hypothetical protein [Stylosanthes scabra]